MNNRYSLAPITRPPYYTVSASSGTDGVSLFLSRVSRVMKRYKIGIHRVSYLEYRGSVIGLDRCQGGSVLVRF